MEFIKSQETRKKYAISIKRAAILNSLFIIPYSRSIVLPKRYRLAKKKDFEKVFKKGRMFSEAFIAVKISVNGLLYSRFGFVVSLKISKKAVERNRIRRQLQEAIRINLKRIKQGFDAVVMVKPEIKGKEYKKIEKVLLGVLEKSGLKKAADAQT